MSESLRNSTHWGKNNSPVPRSLLLPLPFPCSLSVCFPGLKWMLCYCETDRCIHLNVYRYLYIVYIYNIMIYYVYDYDLTDLRMFIFSCFHHFMLWPSFCAPLNSSAKSCDWMTALPSVLLFPLCLATFLGGSRRRTTPMGAFCSLEVEPGRKMLQGEPTNSRIRSNQRR